MNNGYVCGAFDYVSLIFMSTLFEFENYRSIAMEGFLKVNPIINLINYPLIFLFC